MASEKQGYLGNLEEKSIQELKELLTREENILRKKKFVSSLPDKGKKIIEFRQKLLDLISKKQNLYHETALPQTLISSSEEKIKQHLNPLIKPKSRFSEEEKVFKSVENDSVEVTKKDVAHDIVSMESQPRGPEAEAVIMHENKSPMQTTQDNANTLPSPLQTAQTTTYGASEFAKLRDKSHQGDQNTTQVVTNLSCGVNKTPKTAQSQNTDVNMLENAMERMEFGPGVHSIESEELREKILENSAKVSSQFKTNSFLKIHHVEDLPDKYKWKSRQNHPITGPDSSAPHHMTVREDSAATPPDYKYKEARLIPLDESMQLQQAQQKHQEELQAQAAAERLARSLKIKMEPYNPEGRNMLYRTREDPMDTDSDDEPEVEFYPDDVD